MSNVTSCKAFRSNDVIYGYIISCWIGLYRWKFPECKWIVSTEAHPCTTATHEQLPGSYAMQVSDVFKTYQKCTVVKLYVGSSEKDSRSRLSCESARRSLTTGKNTLQTLDISWSNIRCVLYFSEVTSAGESGVNKRHYIPHLHVSVNIWSKIMRGVGSTIVLILWKMS